MQNNKVKREEWLTDLKETFKLNGEASLSLLKVELHQAAFVAAASRSWEKLLLSSFVST